MRRRYRSTVASLLLIAFAAMPLIAFAQACSFAHPGTSTPSPGHHCGDPAPATTPNACQAHCNPEFSLDSGSATPPIAPAAVAMIVELPRFDEQPLTWVEAIPFGGAPPPALRFCRLLI